MAGQKQQSLQGLGEVFENLATSLILTAQLKYKLMIFFRVTVN